LPLRIPVNDKFKDQGHLYIFGKVESGTVIEDQTVSLLPSKAYFVVKELFNARDERLPYAMAGENVKLKVKLIEEDEVNRGNIICNNNNYCQVCY
jgi:peptide chain release factor subunit 3